MKNLQELQTRINSFDAWYMMSDDNRVYNKWSNEETLIKGEIKKLSFEELTELKNGLTIQSFDTITNERIEELKPVEAPAKQSKLSTIMRNAWAMLKDGLFSTMSAALKASWKRWKLTQLLKNGIARFSYIKANRDRREAIGTLRNGNFEYESKGNTKAKSINVVAYFDLVANAFRSVRIDRLIQLG